MARRVAVIGTGMSGLASMKECLEAGLDVQAFEAEDRIGGLWNFTEDVRHSSVYRSTCINTSRDVNTLGDFRMPAELPMMVHWSHMLKYFDQYAAAHNLLPKIRFQTRVLHVLQREDKRWEVEYGHVDSETQVAGPAVKEVFDGVLVCTGHHSVPRIPSFPGLADFEGAKVHSKEYKDSERFAGKRVVVVGIGNSGSDLVTEISKTARATFLVARSGTWLVRNGRVEPKVFTRFDSTVMGYISQPWLNWMMANDPDFSRWKALLTANGLEPKHGFTCQHPTVTLNNDDNNLIEQLEKGKIVGKKGIAAVSAKGVTFTDGSSTEVDAIVFCTGYTIGYPFLDDAVTQGIFGDPASNEVRLYQYMWPTSERFPGIAFIGLAQPVGALAMVSDMQARFAAAVLSGRVSLPSESVRTRQWRELREHNRSWYYDSPRHTIQMAVRLYLDEVSAILGCEPTTWALLREGGPRLALLVLLTPSTSFHYRLVGPGSNRARAEAAIRDEYQKLYKNASNRRGRGLIVDVLSKILLLIPVAILCQIQSLLRRGRLTFKPWI